MMSYNYVQHRSSEMFSNLFFQGNFVLLHSVSFAPPNPREGKSGPKDSLQNVCNCFKSIAAILLLEVIHVPTF